MQISPVGLDILEQNKLGFLLKQIADGNAHFGRFFSCCMSVVTTNENMQ